MMPWHELCKGKYTQVFVLLYLMAPPQFVFLSFFILLPRSCGHGWVWRHARTNPKALCDSGIPAQPGPAGWDLSHNADRQAQIWRLSGVWCDAVTPPLSQQLGEEAANDQNGGTEDAASMMVVYHMGVRAVLFETCLHCCVKHFPFLAFVAVPSKTENWESHKCVISWPTDPPSGHFKTLPLPFIELGNVKCEIADLPWRLFPF